MRRTIVRRSLISVLWLLPAAIAVAAERPNFVIILADDLGYADLGCYGNQVNRTPAIDRLAREGLRFTDFHSNGANCSPTRAALLTRRYQQRMGIEGALGENARGLDQGETTMAELLREAGYATPLYGKWHLGYQPTNGPNRHGFESFVGHLHGATDYISHVDRYGRRDWWHNEQPSDEAGYNTTLITDHAVKFIEVHRDQPFLLFVSHSTIHFPWMLPEDQPQRQSGQRYEGSAGKLGPHVGGPVQPVVQRMIEELDKSVARIVDALTQSKLNQQTLVLFTSDNGGIVRTAGVPIRPENRISDNSPWRGQKHGLYEGGHRVPALAWWPGAIAAGSESSELTATMDLLPTLLELANVSPPAELELDGISLAAHLRKQTPLADRTLFWRQGDSRAVREKQWKLVRIHDGPDQLYNLAKDPAERRDLFETEPAVRDRLLAAWQAWEDRVSP